MCLRLPPFKTSPRHATDNASTEWSLTNAGKSCLHISRRLHHCRRILVPPPSINIMESSAFELACILHQRGWVCSVKPAGRRKCSSKSKVGPGDAPNVVDYTPGEDKRWWIKHDQTNFKPIYMRALLMADTMIRNPIPHLKAENYYESLLKGETPVRKNRTSTFDIDGTVKPQRKQRKRAEESKASITKSRLKSSDPDDASGGKSSSSPPSSTSTSSSSTR